jgi:hypothetical protein
MQRSPFITQVQYCTVEEQHAYQNQQKDPKTSVSTGASLSSDYPIVAPVIRTSQINCDHACLTKDDMWVPGNGYDQPSGAYSTTHGVAKLSCCGLSKFTQTVCHGGIEALDAYLVGRHTVTPLCSALPCHFLSPTCAISVKKRNPQRQDGTESQGIKARHS